MQTDMFGQSDGHSKSMNKQSLLNENEDFEQPVAERHTHPISPKRPKVNFELHDGNDSKNNSSELPGWFSNISNLSGQIVINNYYNNNYDKK